MIWDQPTERHNWAEFQTSTYPNISTFFPLKSKGTLFNRLNFLHFKNVLECVNELVALKGINEPLAVQPVKVFAQSSVQ